MTLIYFAGSINFKTDEYCLQLHLEVIERNIYTFPPWRSSVLFVCCCYFILELCFVSYLPTLKVSGSNPHRDRLKKMFAVVISD